MLPLMSMFDKWHGSWHWTLHATHGFEWLFVCAMQVTLAIAMLLRRRARWAVLLFSNAFSREVVEVNRLD